MIDHKYYTDYIEEYKKIFVTAVNIRIYVIKHLLLHILLYIIS